MKYSCNFSFNEESTNVVLLTIGERKQNNTEDINKMQELIYENNNKLNFICEEIEFLKNEINILQEIINEMLVQSYSFENKSESSINVLESKENDNILHKIESMNEKIDILSKQLAQSKIESKDINDTFMKEESKSLDNSNLFRIIFCFITIVLILIYIIVTVIKK